MLEDYEKALADLNIFCRQRIKNYNEEKHVITEQTVVKFIMRLCQMKIIL